MSIVRVIKTTTGLLDGPFLTFPQFLFQSYSYCEIVVMVISSGFKMNEK